VPIYIRTVYSSPDIPESERADGYLGLSILSNFALTLDYKARQLTLDRRPVTEAPTDSSPPKALAAAVEPAIETAAAVRPAERSTGTDLGTGASTVRQPSPIADGFEVPIRSTSGGLVSTETNLPGVDRPLNFIIDTGASTSVISKSAVKAYQLENLKMPGVKVRVIGAAGISDDTEALGLNTLPLVLSSTEFWAVTTFHTFASSSTCGATSLS
ncbi:MAG: hypothetical protein EBU88_17575, partial [Acidobacteria bacterium]|nr:hypothetical protein [Acidobacteriota bacterium]